jgi:hypothetical protein
MSGIISDNTLRQSGLIKASAGGAWTFLAKSTASSSSTLSFTSGIDDTYGTYVFTFNNMHPSTSAKFQFNMSVDTGSNYNVTKTATCYLAYHHENGTGADMGYNTSHDLAQSTGFQTIAATTVADADASCSGYLYLFDPSSTTFLKHYMSVSNRMDDATTNQMFISGYGNTTSAVDAIQFKFHTGDMDAGDICLYGITT